MAPFNKLTSGEHGGSVIEHPTPEPEVGGSKPTSAEFCDLEQDTLLHESTGNIQEAVAPSPHY